MFKKLTLFLLLTPAGLLPSSNPAQMPEIQREAAEQTQSDAEACPICYEPLGELSLILHHKAPNQPKHRSCQSCIKTILAGKGGRHICPLCRIPLNYDLIARQLVIQGKLKAVKFEGDSSSTININKVNINNVDFIGTDLGNSAALQWVTARCEKYLEDIPPNQYFVKHEGNEASIHIFAASRLNAATSYGQALPVKKTLAEIYLKRDLLKKQEEARGSLRQGREEDNAIYATCVEGAGYSIAIDKKMLELVEKVCEAKEKIKSQSWLRDYLLLRRPDQLLIGRGLRRLEECDAEIEQAQQEFKDSKATMWKFINEFRKKAGFSPEDELALHVDDWWNTPPSVAFKSFELAMDRLTQNFNSLKRLTTADDDLQPDQQQLNFFIARRLRCLQKQFAIASERHKALRFLAEPEACLAELTKAHEEAESNSFIGYLGFRLSSILASRPDDDASHGEAKPNAQ